jgi:adhesin/invasin
MQMIGGDAQMDTIGAKFATALQVRITDAYGNAVPGVVVTWTTVGGSILSLPTSPTDASGIASDTLKLGTTTGLQGATATVSGVPGSPINFTATATHGNAITLALNAGNAQTDTIGTTLGTQYAVRVSDRGNNAVDGVTVSWAAAAGSITASSVTALNGVAVATRTLGNSAGAQPSTATVAGLTGSPVNFTATATHGNATTIVLNAGNAQTDTIGTTLPIAYAVRITDRATNPVNGATVNWSATGGSITASSVTNASGVASATRTLGNTAGAQPATATAAALPGSPIGFTATATHGNATTLAINGGNLQSATVNTAVPVDPSAIVTDRAGNPVAGISVTFSATASNGVVVPATALITNAAGVAQVTSWTLGAVAKPDTLFATSGALSGSPLRFTATAISGSASAIALSGGNAQTDTISATLLEYSILITDNVGNPVSGIPVAWAVTGGGGTITPTSNTNASGIAVATRVLGTTPGAAAATASVGGLTGSPVQFTATTLVGNAASIAVFGGNAQSATVATNVATAPSVRVTDRVGNSFAGRAVTFAVTGGGGAVNPVTSVNTNASGVAQVTSWTLGNIAGANSLSATSAGLTGSPVAITATGTAGAVSAAQSALSAGTSSITACSVSCVAGSTASTVTVTARDQFGNVISGASVVVGSTGTNNTFAPSGSGTTNASGVFTTTFNSTTAQAKTVSATANAVGVTQTAAVTVNAAAVSLTSSLFSAATASITACNASCVNGVTQSAVTVTVQDAFSNPISGATVTPSCSVGSSCVFTTVSGNTNASGVFTTSFRSTLAEAKTLRGAVSGTGNITQTAAVTVVAAAPASVAVTNAGASARVGIGLSTRPTYTVRDAFSNLVPNYPVTYSSSNSGAFAGPSSTNASGQATLTSWVMSDVAADDAQGRMANNVTLFANGFSGTATSYGIYSYLFDVQSWTNDCGDCHANPVAPGYVNVASSCVGVPYITSGNANLSLSYQVLVSSYCGVSQMPYGRPGLSAVGLKVIRAWINNGAPNN